MASLQRHAAQPFTCGRTCSRPRRVLVRAAGEQGPGGPPPQAQQVASIKPAGPRAAPRPGPPRGPPGVIMGPDGQPLKVVPIEKEGAEAWAGVAAVDRGDSDERAVDWGRVALLVGGDAAALIAFAAIGRINHGEPLAGALDTALPFLIGWFATAPFLGGYSREARGGATGAAAAAAAKCWAAAAPLGLVIRGVSKGYVPPTPFIIVSLVATAVIMIGWRAGLAAATPEAAPQSAAALAKSRANKQGNPLEFLELLMSLTKRW